MSIDKLKKFFCNICGYCFVEWWVNPDISRSIFWFLSLIFGVFKINFETTFSQSIFVFTFCCVEYLLIKRFFDSLLWIEFGIFFMTFGGWFDKV